MELEVLTDQSAAVVAIPKAAIVETNDKKKSCVCPKWEQHFSLQKWNWGKKLGDAVEVKSWTV